MKSLLVCFCFILTLAASAKDDPKYPVSAIPEELTKDVNVVFREDHLWFTIHSKSRSSYRVRQVITIMNPNGKRYAFEVVGYDKLSKIVSLHAAAYNAQGGLIKKLKNSEIYDQSAYDGFSLYSDNRLKAVDLSQGTYPYTVEFEYEVEYKSLFFIPAFTVVPGEKISVEHSSYSLIFPKGQTPRYNTVSITSKPVSTTTGEMESLVWSFENVKPIKKEPLGPSMQEIAPRIEAAPTQFEYDGYNGDMQSWDKFGQWITMLNRGRGILPEETKQKIKDITSPLKTNEEKIKAVYEYMQNRTRYVSIQLGIGGFQPFEASVVDKTGYGDCKALSNYMVSMLDVAGIKANYTLIRAGEDAASMNEQFPSSQFNHAVVFVPNNGDTLWLECTSQTNPFGYMGTFTGDRKALAITENGAKVVRTPIYVAENNIQSRTAEVFVEATGDAKAKVRTTYSGLQYENDNLNFLLGNQYDEQKKWIQKNTSIPSFDINSFTMKNVKDKIPSAIVNLDLSLRRFATVSGKRIFLSPNLMNRSTFIPEKVENRKTKVICKTAYIDFDTIVYHLPEGIYPEFLPEPVKLKSKFGEYESSFKVDGEGLIYTRRIRMNKGEFPAESYNELIDFYRSVSKADNVKMVFMSKT